MSSRPPDPRTVANNASTSAASVTSPRFGGARPDLRGGGGEGGLVAPGDEHLASGPGEGPGDGEADAAAAAGDHRALAVEGEGRGGGARRFQALTSPARRRPTPRSCCGPSP